MQFSQQSSLSFRPHRGRSPTITTPTPRRTAGQRVRSILKDIAFVALAVVLIGFWQSRTLVDGFAPDFAGEQAQGPRVSLSASLQAADEPLLLHFWASWCGVCKMMDQSISAIADDVPTLTIAYQSDDARAVARHLEERQLTFPAVVDAQGAIAHDYGITAVPTTFILRPDGRIAYRTVGYSTAWGLRARLWLARHF